MSEKHLQWRAFQLRRNLKALNILCKKGVVEMELLCLKPNLNHKQENQNQFFLQKTGYFLTSHKYQVVLDRS